jgi:hypothetical protein
MTTVPAALVGLLVLSSAGLLPTIALVGVRFITLPLLPLVGAVVAAVAATCFMAVGGSFIGWFVALAAGGVLVVVAYWKLRPERRPWRDQAGRATRNGPWARVVGVVGALAILGACAWCLRGLATPTVGFDARALWLMRAGWFLQSQHQLRIDMRVRDVVLVQTPYPPLVSASAALAWRVTGDQSVRLGVVIIALLNTCALAVAAFALIESSRHFAHRMMGIEGDGPVEPSTTEAVSLGGRVPLTPLVVGVVSAVLLVFVAFGVTEPFMTNGYADPLWSLAAVGAVAYGLQMRISRANQGVALILVLVAGMSKDEGIVTAVALIVLIAIRNLVTMSLEERHKRWWRPILLGMAELGAVAVWPVLMRIIHARGVSMSVPPLHEMPGRARAALDGMWPYLHVIVLAAPLAVVGGVVLSRVRRKSELANDWWAWAGLISGLGAVSAGYVTGTSAVQVWLVGTVDRVTEFPALTGWWIVALWAVVASGAPAAARHPSDPPPGGFQSENGSHINTSAERALAGSAVVAE